VDLCSIIFLKYLISEILKRIRVLGEDEDLLVRILVEETLDKFSEFLSF